MNGIAMSVLAGVAIGLLLLVSVILLLVSLRLLSLVVKLERKIQKK